LSETDYSISVRNLSKRYKLGQTHREQTFREVLTDMFKGRRRKPPETIWALREVSFDVKEGEVLGIIGRNGAGKSTLLKLLSRITYPTAGEVMVRGRISSLLEVGTGFHLELTGRENVYLAGSILGMKKREIDERFDDIVEFANVRQFLDTPIKRYSTGMRLRLGFAVAAHLDPDVLLVDEVLAVGDAGFQKKCLNAMRDLRTTGRTVLFVSHNMAAVENLCHRAIWIDNGRIKDDGTARDVIKKYLATFTESQTAGYDLEKIESRRGSGEIRYTGIEFLTRDGNPVQLVSTGDGFVVRLYYRAVNKVMNPHFGFMLTTEFGTLITELSTWLSGFDIPVIEPGEGHIDLEIDSLAVMPSQYFISLWIEGVGPVHYDVLEHCASLDVTPADFYGSGREMSTRFGLMAVPCHWKLDHSRSGSRT
jgi:lipopolysaccharide transport system ATP-binding protein